MRTAVAMFTARLHSSGQTPSNLLHRGQRLMGALWPGRELEVRMLSCTRRVAEVAPTTIKCTLNAPAPIHYHRRENSSKPGLTSPPARHRRVWLLSSFSLDDTDQLVLIPHWLRHYIGNLGLNPEHFILILHSESKDFFGLSVLAGWLRDAWGVGHSELVTEPYSSMYHMYVKHQLLRRFVHGSDWIMQVDADEFVQFPSGHLPQHVFMELEERGENVHYGFMVDRLSADGSVDVIPNEHTSLFTMFPLNCAVTAILQQSDVRKVTAYRGYLRVTSGNHNVLGINGTTKAKTRRSPRLDHKLRNALKNFFLENLNEIAFEVLPTHYKEGPLPHVRPSKKFSTVYHFKWIRGLAGKLERRAERWASNPKLGSISQYTDLRGMLSDRGRFPPEYVSRLCSVDDLQESKDPARPLTSLELLMLFLNIKQKTFEAIIAQNGIAEHSVDDVSADLLGKSMSWQTAREDLPVHKP